MKKKSRRKKKKYKQTGETFRPLDLKLRALPPGWRISESGNRYFEARKNRSDQKGKKI